MSHARRQQINLPTTMNDTAASESPEVVTSKGIGSSALLGSASPFARWWAEEGSSMAPQKGEDAEEHTKRVAEVAWAKAKAATK